MKILLVTNALGRGGIEQNIVRLTREFISLGHSVIVASGYGPLVPEVVSAGGKHVDCSLARQPAALVRSVWRLRRTVRGPDRPDVIHNFAATMAVLLWLAEFGARRSRCPTVASIMGLKASPQEPELWSRLRAWVTALGADRLLVISPAIREVVQKLPIASGRVSEARVVGVPLPPSDTRNRRRDEVRRQLGINPDQPVVTTIGRLAPDKTHHLFIEAAALARDRMPRAQFLVAGEGACRPALEEQIESAGLAGTVRLLGASDDVEGILAASDVCVKPGTVEGFVGITVLEAQALGVPVVAFETEDVKLAIQDGVSGLIVRPGDIDALARAIHRVVTDKALANHLSEAGRSSVRNFEIGNVAADLVGVYSQVREGGLSL